MNQENKEIAESLRKEFKQLQSDRLIKIESERKLSEKLSVGRQRIREVINELVSEGLLIKYDSLDANIMIAECFALMDMATDKGESLHKKVILQPTLITRDTLKRINERKVL